MAEERQYLRNDTTEAVAAFRTRRKETLELFGKLTPVQWTRRHSSRARPDHHRRIPLAHGLARRQPPRPAHASAGRARVANAQDQRGLPEPAVELPLRRGQAAHPGAIATRTPASGDRPRHRRRDAAAPPAVVRALDEAAGEKARAETLPGYGPYVGYEFLRARSPRTTSAPRRQARRPTRSSSATAARATAPTSRRSSRRTAVVALMDPAYPVYADSNVMAGRAGRADASGRYAASCTCRAPPRTTSSRRCPTGTSTSSTSATRTIPPAR